jgi:hypothetical protein
MSCAMLAAATGAMTVACSSDVEGEGDGVSTLLTRLALQGADLGAYLSLKPYPKERYLANHAVLSPDPPIRPCA